MTSWSTSAAKIPATGMVMMVLCAVAGGEEIDGFTAPFRSTDIASAETGILAGINVRVGEHVEAGDVLARLDDELHRQRVSMARQATSLQGRLAVARAELSLDEKRLANLLELQTRGNAHQEEVDRAVADVEISSGQLLGIQEELLMKQHELAYAEIQLQRRTVKSPLSGVVSQIHKDPGEFVGPGDSQILTVVELDPLLAVFSIPSPLAGGLRQRRQVAVRMVESDTFVEGTVHLMAPIIDGRSGTIRVEVRLDNSAGKLLSGEPCTLVLPRDEKSEE